MAYEYNNSTFSMIRYRSSTYFGTAAALRSQIDTKSWEPVEAEKVVSSAAHAVQCTTTSVTDLPSWQANGFVAEGWGVCTVYNNFTLSQSSNYRNNKYYGKIESGVNEEMTISVKDSNYAFGGIQLTTNEWREIGENPIDCVFVRPHLDADYRHITVTFNGSVTCSANANVFSTSTVLHEFTITKATSDFKIFGDKFIVVQGMDNMRSYNNVWWVNEASSFIFVPKFTQAMTFSMLCNSSMLERFGQISSRPWAKTEWPEA